METTTCFSKDDWIRCDMHIHNEISFNHEKDFLPWMDLEEIMLNELSQTQKNQYCMIPLYMNS